MTQDPQARESVARTVTVDLVVAVMIFAVGAVVVFDSVRLGAGWGSDGPGSGYFPFYIGALLCISSGVVFIQSLLNRKDAAIFVEKSQFKQVLIILVPSIGYALGVQFIGIYVSSTVFIGLFMRFVGKYTWLRSVTVALAVSLIAFVLFEIWFTIPLPKGPLETLMGY